MNLKLQARHIQIGRRGENAACTLLQRKNYTILARNWRTKAGELDIVARDGRTLVFVEVKTLRFHPNFVPSGNLSAHQRKRNQICGKLYRKMLELTSFPARYDLIEIVCQRHWPYRIMTMRHTPDYLPPLPELP